MRSDIFFDSPVDALEFVDIIADLPLQATVDEARQSATLDICEPLRDADLQTPAVLIPIIAANDLAALHLRNGENVEVARCAAIAQAKMIPLDITYDNFEGYETFHPDSGAFVRECR